MAKLGNRRVGVSVLRVCDAKQVMSRGEVRLLIHDLRQVLDRGTRIILLQRICRQTVARREVRRLDTKDLLYLFARRFEIAFLNSIEGLGKATRIGRGNIGENASVCSKVDNRIPRRGQLVAFVLLVSLAGPASSQKPDAWKDPSPHTTRFVTVDNNVRLEVLDWGGSGRPLVLLAGGGDTAHVFDDFAPKLTARYHVYAITRRGFGASGYSATDNPADRLGDDVSAIINSLKLNRTILVGHSIAGAELSSVANSHPDQLGGLIYLDAGYSYAFDNGKGASIKEIQELHAPQPPQPSATNLASFSALQKYYDRVNGFRFPEAELRQQRESTPDGRVGKERDFPGGSMLMALIMGTKKYTDIPIPALFIFGNPHSLGTWVDDNTDPSVRTAAKAYSTALTALTERQENAVKNGLPMAHVITLPGANHYVFLSNEADVLREIRAFLSGSH
jgi:non-heme chloroperoxidase